MIDARAAAVLLDLLQRERRSLLQYVSESLPWPTSEAAEPLARLERLIAAEKQQIAALGRFLVRHRIMPPPLPQYPMDFTTMNFVSLDHLLPLFVEEQKKAITLLERDVASVSAAEALAMVNQMLETKRQHLQALEAMAAVHAEKAGAQPAAAST